MTVSDLYTCCACGTSRPCQCDENDGYIKYIRALHYELTTLGVQLSKCLQSLHKISRLEHDPDCVIQRIKNKTCTCHVQIAKEGLELENVQQK